MSLEPPILTCDECGEQTDAEWHRQSGGLCGNCLANYGMPLTRIEPPTQSDDYCVACDDYHDPDEGPCAVIVVGDDSD